ncbi:MAG: hypothetical protein O3C68_01800 [Proteobacteria bacterium]|nr:hypothetical protein [Pseudomonadota bacterium]
MIVFVVFLLVLSSGASAYESDQYTNRTQDVADSLDVLDREVNQAIRNILARKNPPRSKGKIAKAIYFEIGGLYWADKIERWAAKSPEVEKYDQTRRESVYKGMPFWATRVNFIFGVGRSFRVNGVMVGSDKFGHFVSQGYKYYMRELRGERRESLLRKGWFAERWIFGELTTGVFSNADLVANYEGWRFYQSLFEDNVSEGKTAILTLEGNGYGQQRPFTFADHINDYWDEALNPSYTVPSLNRRLRKAIKALCPEYHENPEFYSLPDDAQLWARYESLGLKDSRQNQFVAICRQ